MLYRKNIFEWKEENRTKITQTGVHALTMFLISVQEWQNKNTQTGAHALTMFLISVQEWQNQNNQTGVHALTMFLISVQEWQNQNNQTGELCFLSLSRNVICCASLFTFKDLYDIQFIGKKSISNILPEIGTFCFFTLNKWKPSYAAEMTTRMQYRFTAQYFTRNGNCLICSPENS